MKPTGWPWLQSAVVSAGQRVIARRSLRSSTCVSGITMVKGVMSVISRVLSAVSGSTPSLRGRCATPPDRSCQQANLDMRPHLSILMAIYVYNFGGCVLALSIKDGATESAVRRLARLKHKSLTQTIKEAVDNEYHRARAE